MGYALLAVNIVGIGIAGQRLIANGRSGRWQRAIAWAAVLIALLVAVALVSFPLVMAR